MVAVAAVGAILTGSLAVLADAGHLLSDVGAIALGLLAASLAARPGAGRRTFGYQRSEVLAALATGLLLVAASVGGRGRHRDRACRPLRRPAGDRRRRRPRPRSLRACRQRRRHCSAGGRRAPGPKPRGRPPPQRRRRAWIDRGGRRWPR